MKNTTRTTMRNSRRTAGSSGAGMKFRPAPCFRRSFLTLEASGIELPAAIEAAIPPAEEDQDPIIASIAENEMEIIAEDVAEEAETVLDDTAVPDNSGEDPAVWSPITGGENCEPRIVLYDPGDGIPRAIPDPLGIL